MVDEAVILKIRHLKDINIGIDTLLKLIFKLYSIINSPCLGGAMILKQILSFCLCQVSDKNKSPGCFL